MRVRVRVRVEVRVNVRVHIIRVIVRVRGMSAYRKIPLHRRVLKVVGYTSVNHTSYNR